MPQKHPKLYVGIFLSPKDDLMIMAEDKKKAEKNKEKTSNFLKKRGKIDNAE